MQSQHKLNTNFSLRIEKLDSQVKTNNSEEYIYNNIVY